MDQINENEWVVARENEIEAMWAMPLPISEPVEITEDDLPF